MSPAERFHRNLNNIILAGVGAFLISFTAASIQWYRINGSLIETTFFPAATDYTFTDWQRDPTGRWSAVVWVNKRRSECSFIVGQIETLLGELPDGEIEESLVTHVGDTSPGGNRVTGFQRLDDRLQIENPDFVAGTKFRGSVLHRCHEGAVTVTEFGPFVVGENMVLPTL